MEYLLLANEYDGNQPGMLIKKKDLIDIYWFDDKYVLRVVALNDDFKLSDDDFKAIRESDDMVNELSVRYPNVGVGEVSDGWFPRMADDWGVYYVWPDESVYERAEDLETELLYEWWDGRNWNSVRINEDTVTTAVEIDDESGFTLDSWDGSNWYTGGIFNHEFLFHVIYVDNEPTTTQWLHIITSDYREQHPSGEIFTQDQAFRYISNLPNKEELVDKIK